MSRQRGRGDLPSLDPARPKNQQIREALRSLARDRDPGTPLPSERTLSAEFGVARMTVRQCLDELESDGVVRRLPGRGTFVAEPAALRIESFGSFSADMHHRGLTPGTARIRVQTRGATNELARQLGVSTGDPIHTVDRTRTADGVPIAVSRSNLAQRRFPGLPDLLDAGSSLYDVLARQFSVRTDSADDRITAGSLTKRDAGLLGVEPGSPALVVDRIGRDTAGAVVEVSRTTYRADRYALSLHLDRPR